MENARKKKTFNGRESNGNERSHLHSCLVICTIIRVSLRGKNEVNHVNVGSVGLIEKNITL